MKNGKLTGFLAGLLLVTLPFGALAAKKPLEQAEDEGINLLPNPGFENGKAGWTASGGSFTLASGTSARVGKRSAVFDASAGGQRLTGTQVSTTASGIANLAGATVKAYCTVQGAANDYSLQAVDGSLNVLATRTIPSIIAPEKQIIGTSSFTMPESGTVSVSILSASDAAALSVDNCWLGTSGLIDISQAELYGTIKVTGCNAVFEQNSATFDNSDSSPTGCVYTPTGKVSAPILSPSQLAVRLVSAPPGKYVFVATGQFGKGNSATYTPMFRFSDGTNHAEENAAVFRGDTPTMTVPEFSGNITYTTPQSDITVRVQGLGDGTNSAIWYGTNASPGTIKVFRYPIASEQAMRFDTVAQSWRGYHGMTCGWSTTSGIYANFTGDATCTLTTLESTNLTATTVSDGTGPQPAIQFAPGAAGDKFEICASTQGYHGDTNASLGLRLWDASASKFLDEGTQRAGSGSLASNRRICGHTTFPSTSAKVFQIQGVVDSGTGFVGSAITSSGQTATIVWSITKLGQQVPAPIIVGGVVSSSAGVERMERAFVGETACTGSPCTIASQTGAFSSITRSVTGTYTANHSGYSARPNCSVRAAVTFGSGGTPLTCVVVAGATSSSFIFQCRDPSGVNVDSAFEITCQGPR